MSPYRIERLNAFLDGLAEFIAIALFIATISLWAAVGCKLL